MDTPPRPRPNSRVPRSGIRNWLTDDQVSAMSMPTPSMSQKTRSSRGAIARALSAPRERGAAGGVGGKRRRSARPSTGPMSSGAAATGSERFQGQWAGRNPISASPPRMPSIPENSKRLRRNEPPAPPSF